MTDSMPPRHPETAFRVRPYTLTGGRTSPTVELPIAAEVRALSSALEASSLCVALRRVLKVLSEPGSPAEVPDDDRRVVVSACAGVMAELGYEADGGEPRTAPPDGDSLEKVLSLRRWHASVGTMPLPIY